MRKVKLLVMADGTSIHTEKWIKGLIMTGKFDVYFLTMTPGDIREGIVNNPDIAQVFGVPTATQDYHKQKGGNFHYFKGLIKTKKIIRDLNPDIINTIYLTSYGFLGALLKGKALLVHFLIGSDAMVTPFKNIFYRWLTKFALSRGDFFVVASQTMYKVMLKLGAIPKDKLLIQQYGIDDEIINYPQQRKEYDFVSNRIWVVNSNILMILEIFSKMNPLRNLVVVGDKGTMEREIKEKMRSLPNIQHFGILPYMKNIEALAKSKFFVSLTLSDGASLSLLEAMAVGAIPVLSDIEPNREWVSDGDNGFLIDLNDFPGAIRKFNYIASLPEEKLKIMREKNAEIIKRRGSLRKNMERFSSCVLSLMKSRNKLT